MRRSSARQSQYPACASSQFTSQFQQSPLTPTINGLYKAECLRTTVFHDGPYKTIGDVEYDQAHYAALNREPNPL
jgi:hypothetical protein